MAYKLSSNCVGDGKVVQKAPYSTLVTVPAVRPKWFTRVMKAKWKLLAFEEKVLLFPWVLTLITLDSWGAMCLFALSTTGAEGVAVGNPVAATLLYRAWHLEPCLLLIQKTLLMAYHLLSIMYKDKILKCGARQVIKRNNKECDPCDNTGGKHYRSRSKEASSSDWEGLKKALWIHHHWSGVVKISSYHWATQKDKVFQEEVMQSARIFRKHTAHRGKREVFDWDAPKQGGRAVCGSKIHIKNYLNLYT